MGINNIFALVNSEQNEEISDLLMQADDIRIERIVSTGQTSPKKGWYEQIQNEWVAVLQGEAIITFEDKEVEMKPGSFINIPAHTKHKVSWTHPQMETVWLAVFY